jgi:hypothetical protein
MSAQQNSAEKLTGTVAEAGEVLGVGHNQAYEAARRGDIPTKRIGKRIVVLWQPFLRMLKGEAA